MSASTVGLYKEANIKHIVCYMSCYDGFKISRQLKRLFTELLSRPAGGWNTNVFTVNSIVDLVLTLTLKPAACYTLFTLQDRSPDVSKTRNIQALQTRKSDRMRKEILKGLCYRD